MISSPHALADQLECHSLPVTFPSSMRATPLPVPWIGVVVRRWHHTNPNGNHNHDHNHNDNPNELNWIMVNCWTIRKQIREVFAVLYIYAFHWLYILGGRSWSCYIVHIISWYNSELGFLSTYPNSALYTDIPWKSEAPCLVNKVVSTELNVCEHHLSRWVVSYLHIQHIHQYKE